MSDEFAAVIGYHQAHGNGCITWSSLMSELPTRGDLSAPWWGIIWPRASRNCSRASRALSLLGAPVALLVGVLLAIGLTVLLPLFAAVLVLSNRFANGRQLPPSDVVKR
jgi:hypothetical protein